MAEYKGKTKSGFEYVARTGRTRLSGIGRLAAEKHSAHGYYFKVPQEIIERLDEINVGGARATAVAGLLLFALDRIKAERLEFQVYPDPAARRPEV